MRHPGDPESRPVFRIVTSAGEAEEHLRVIRQAMERSTRHSTLSGMSGMVVGGLALLACLLTNTLVPKLSTETARLIFGAIWGGCLLLAILSDFILTKRRAARVGKTPFSPLGKHLARAAAPGLAAAVLLTLFFWLHPNRINDYLYGVWMLCYAVSLLAVGMFSVREVSLLGWAFLAAGAATLLLPYGFPLTPLGMMAATFGGFHIYYGAWMGAKYGW